jgi:hypothetical protein
MKLLRLIRSLKARIAALETENARLLEPDMFWGSEHFGALGYEDGLYSALLLIARATFCEYGDVHEIELECSRHLESQCWVVRLIDDNEIEIIGLASSPEGRAAFCNFRHGATPAEVSTKERGGV